MPSGCLVPGCTEKSRLGQSVSFHGLPVKDAQRCKLWLRAINNPRVGEDTGKEIIKGKTICSLHFKLEDFDGRLFGKIRSALKPTAVPSYCRFRYGRRG
uniref:THAP-type domain-containing protein n=1 Tax=Gadus morhua TaxID=8049 RepID=A0A8C5AYI2_GADMO